MHLTACACKCLKNKSDAVSMTSGCRFFTWENILGGYGGQTAPSKILVERIFLTASGSVDLPHRYERQGRHLHAILFQLAGLFWSCLAVNGPRGCCAVMDAPRFGGKIQSDIFGICLNLSPHGGERVLDGCCGLRQHAGGWRRLGDPGLIWRHRACSGGAHRGRHQRFPNLA